MAQQAPTTNFQCDGCNEMIPDLKARIHCQICADHDLCTNCYVLGIHAQHHSKTHISTIIARSGYSVQIPPVSPPRPKAPNLQPPISSLVHRPAPVPSPTMTPVVQSILQGGWKPLFSSSSATPTLVVLLSAVFKQLDTDKDGLITPEQYTSFLEVQQYTNEEHIWKRFHHAQWVYTADDVADYELTTILENFSIPHTMLKRPGANTAATGRSFSNDFMPMLTLSGFIDITVIETLIEPEPGWKRVNKIARHYQFDIWKQRGDCPRNMMPQNPPKELVERVARATRLSAQRNENIIGANAARLNAELANQEECLRMLDPPGTRYYYSR